MLQPARVSDRVAVPRGAKSVQRVNLIEDPLPDAKKPAVAGATVRVALRPFEIATVRVRM